MAILFKANSNASIAIPMYLILCSPSNLQLSTADESSPTQEFPIKPDCLPDAVTGALFCHYQMHFQVMLL